LLATYLPDFKTGEIVPCRFSKSLGAFLRHLSSNKSKGFELAGFKKLSANSKAFGAKMLGTYLFSIKFKPLSNKIMNICRIFP
jgi:hypothetical protein